MCHELPVNAILWKIFESKEKKVCFLNNGFFLFYLHMYYMYYTCDKGIHSSIKDFLYVQSCISPI